MAYYTRSNTLLIFALAALLVALIAIGRRLWTRRSRRRYAASHPFLRTFGNPFYEGRSRRHNDALVTEAMMHALDGEDVMLIASDEEQAERVFEKAREYFEKHYDFPVD